MSANILIWMDINEWGIHNDMQEWAEHRAKELETHENEDHQNLGVAFRNLSAIIGYILDRVDVPEPQGNPYWKLVEAEKKATGKERMIPKSEQAELFKKYGITR